MNNDRFRLKVPIQWIDIANEGWAKIDVALEDPGILELY